MAWKWPDNLGKFLPPLSPLDTPTPGFDDHLSRWGGSRPTPKLLEGQSQGGLASPGPTPGGVQRPGGGGTALFFPPPWWALDKGAPLKGKAQDSVANKECKESRGLPCCRMDRCNGLDRVPGRDGSESGAPFFRHFFFCIFDLVNPPF